MTGVHAKAGLERLLEALGDKRPALARGDCGYGNEGILSRLEEREQRYLLHLRQTKAVTSRPLLLTAVGKTASHAGQTLLYLTPLHGKAQTIKTLVANVCAALQHVYCGAVPP